MRNYICIPLAGMVILSAVVMTVAAMYTYRQRYNEILCVKNKTLEADRNFYHDVCTNSSLVERYRRHQDCINAEHAFHTDPADLAAAEVLSQFGFCFWEDCAKVLEKYSGLAMMVTGFFVVILMTILFLTSIFLRWSYRSIYNNDLPRTVHDYQKPVPQYNVYYQPAKGYEYGQPYMPAKRIGHKQM
jgi:hypothetical protein